MTMDGRIDRIARRVMAMSQMVKKCVFRPDGTVTGVIEELIYHKDGNDMAMFDEIFTSDVAGELNDIGVPGPLKSGMTVSIDQGDYVKFRYKFTELADNWDLEQLRTHEWVVTDRSK